MPVNPEQTTARLQILLGTCAVFLALGSAVFLGGNRPLIWTLLALGTLVLFAAQLSLSLLRKPVPAQRRAVPYVVGYTLVLAWALVQALLPVGDGLAHPVWRLAPPGSVPRIGADPGPGVHHVMRLAAYGMLAWIVLASSLSRDRAWAIVRTIALASTALAVFGIGAAASDSNPLLGPERVSSVVSATFVNRNSYATFAAFGVLANVAVYLRLMEGQPVSSLRGALRTFLTRFFAGAWLFALGALLCGAALALTESRGGAIAGLAGLALMLALGGRRRPGAAFMVLGLLVVLMVYVLVVLGGGTMERLLSGAGGASRPIVYAAAFEQFLDRPLLGHGIGAFRDVFRAAVPPEVAGADWARAHNTFLENLFELGLPAAAVFYVSLLGIAITIARGVIARGRDGLIPLFALSSIVTAAVHSCVDFSLQMPANAALFACILGVGWAQSFGREDRGRHRSRRAQ